MERGMGLKKNIFFFRMREIWACLQDEGKSQ